MCIGVPVQIVAQDPNDPNLAQVVVGSDQQEVDLSLVGSHDETGQTRLGQWVIVNHGYAMTLVDEADAQMTLQAFEEIGNISDDLQGFIPNKDQDHIN